MTNFFFTPIFLSLCLLRLACFLTSKSSRVTCYSPPPRLLSTWCDWHCHARQFLLATALLNTGEQEKAADLLLSAAGGVPGDRFLTEHLLRLQGEDGQDLTVSYFLRAIALLEQFSCPDLVISLAETGLAVAPQGHKERPTLAYILFR